MSNPRRKPAAAKPAAAAAPQISAEPPVVTGPPIEAEPAEAPRDRQPADGRAKPQCPYCSKPAIPAGKAPDGKAVPAKVVLCEAKGGSAFFTRYYCPTKGCSYSEKRQRPRRKTGVVQDEFAAR